MLHIRFVLLRAIYKYGAVLPLYGVSIDSDRALNKIGAIPEKDDNVTTPYSPRSNVDDKMIPLSQRFLH